MAGLICFSTVIVKGLFMSYSLTRRDFLGDAAKAGVVSALKLDLSPLPNLLSLLRRSGSQISTANGDSSKGTPMAPNRRALKTAAGEHWTFPTTGASRVLSAKTPQPRATELICPRASAGTGSSSHSRPQREANALGCSSTGCTSAARSGSTERPWGCGRTGSLPFPTI